jgi:hypothetical protein
MQRVSWFKLQLNREGTRSGDYQIALCPAMGCPLRLARK